MTDDGRGGIGVHAQVSGVAHQEQWRKLAQDCPQPGQSAADAHVLLGFTVAGWAERGQVIEAVGARNRGLQSLIIPEEA